MGLVDRRKFSAPLINMDLRATWLTLLLAVITFATTASSSEPRVVCYYTNWSVYRPGTARFNPQNINPYLCTHLIYAFGGFTKDNTLKPFDKYQDIEKGGYAKFTGLKTYNKNLKTMLAIGGWNEGSTRFSPMVASRERRKEFVKNAIKFLRQNRFDGLDLDWEYPAFRDGGKPKDRENYAKLVKELREEFDRESEKTGRPRLLLTMAVPAGIEYIQKGFDVKTLNKYLDWMNLLTYDYHSAFEPAVNHHAPLYPLEEPNEYSVDNELNIDYTIKFYIENGADRDKLVLGIPTYGRSYTLFNPDATEIGAPADGPGEQGDATREKGYLAYYEICEALKPKKTKKRSTDDEDESEEDEEEEEEDVPWTVVFPNPNAMGPVAYKGNQWVGYDDMDIVRKKSEYVAENGLGGIMFWSIDNDDFRGNCHGKPYPLIEAAKEAYINKVGSTDNTVTDAPRALSSSGNKRRNRPRATSTTTVKPAASAKTQSNKRNKPSASISTTTPSWNIVTPEPPTTPDPGSDFKCTDEGFFPHPRDCKKYFWCLDSGPSNLGIVAHQFTCPSGLFFNKAADSCDFARNVLCKKPAAAASTTKAPPKETTTKAATTTTTTRRPIKLSTKNSALFRSTTTTTTTTPEPEVEDEYEEEEEGEAADIDAEDPRVIKELIDLIKKVGGVEQLEKHLHLAESSLSPEAAATTTPTPFNKKLYQKVLERTRANKLPIGNSIGEGGSPGNSRRGPQNAGIEASNDSDQKFLNKDRPKYTTINRSRGSTTPPPDSVEDEPVPETPQALLRARAVQPEVREVRGTTAKPLQYVNIRRARPATSDTADDTASRNALFERSESYATVSDNTATSIDIASARRENIPEYVTIRRQRPSTEEPTTALPQSNAEEEEEEVESLESVEKEISSPPSQPQYTSIVRSRSTTQAPEPSSPQPTTVLAVQISTLLNNPEETPANTADEETQTDVTEAPTTTSTTTTTTTAPSSAAPSSTTRRPARRRGTTTTTTPGPSSSTTQVSSRNYSFVRRRRPLRPNEIVSETDIENSRKVRSTTPDSLEVEVKVSRDPAPRRFRSRFQTPSQTEDSIPAAATPVSRGQFRPNLNADELVSLTPVDLDSAETPKFIQKSAGFNSARNERRFRGRTSTVSTDNIADSDVSAASVEVKRQNILSRGRSRFVVSSTVQGVDETSRSTEPTISPKRPTFARFSPRPFARTAATPIAEEIISSNQNEPSISTARIPVRLPFGRARPLFSTAQPSIQARKLPFPPRTTVQSVVSEDDEDVVEDRNEDITLSESTIEEQEHEDSAPVTEAIDIPKRRIIVKKLRASSTTEAPEPSSESPASDDTGRRKLKVIRRRPASTTFTAEEVTSPATDAPSTAPPSRVRKIIRKKIKPAEDEPEIIAKSIGSLKTANTPTEESVINYGEKTRSTLSASSVSTTEAPASETTEERVEIEKPEEELLAESDQTDEHPNETQQEQTEEAQPQTSPEIVIENQQQSLDIYENKEASSEPPIASEEPEETEPETTTKTTTQQASTTSRSRSPYKPPKRLFTSSTEPSVPSSSRTYSRKYKVGVYTSPATVDRPESIKPVTRRPLFSSKPFTRRPFTTARTTQKVEEEEEEEYSDEIIDEEPENQFVVLPPNQLFTRKPNSPDINGDEEEYVEEDQEEVEVKSSSRKPAYKPRVVNSNTFRTSTTTTEVPKRVSSSQNRTALFNRFGGSKPVNETKKRVQNVPAGYKPVEVSSEKASEKPSEVTAEDDHENTTAYSMNETDVTTEEDDDDYLTMTESTSTTDDESSTFADSTSTNTGEYTSATEETTFDDDYLEFSDESTSNPSTADVTVEDNGPTYVDQTTYDEQTNGSNTIVDSEITTESIKTTQAPATPRVKTQFNKLFSVSRVVEVSSKLDKHRVNKKNESRLIEEGKIMVEKKPKVDKIGEVSRFSLIKIFEDEIPIYLTKLGHVYPVDNPPDNPIRIDEARNARALMNFADAPRENLVASESMNEAYRHINKVSASKDSSKDQVYHLQSEDDFLSYVNEDKSSETTEKPYALPHYQSDPSEWQFVPAAYENEKNKQVKAAKSFEIITPRNMLTDPSTIALEGLFSKTETPLKAKKINNNAKNKPFLVYSSLPSDKDLAKLQAAVEPGRTIKTYVKGQELIGGSVDEDLTYPADLSVVPLSTTESTTDYVTIMVTETITTSPLVDMLTNQPTTEAITTNAETTTETIPDETTTTKISPFIAKRTKFAFPRRPIASIGKTNVTRPNPPALASLKTVAPNRVPKKINATISNNLIKKSNKTSTFTPSNKSRFTVNRVQNVPIDLKSKKPIKSPKTYTTEAPRTTTERRLYVKPIRPNLRPAFIPRKNTQTSKSSLVSRRKNFLRRTKATPVAEVTESIQPETAVDTTTPSLAKYTRRGFSKFKTGQKKEQPPVKVEKEIVKTAGNSTARAPSLPGGRVRSEQRVFVRRRGGANVTSTSTTARPTQALTTRHPRPFRVASRRRPVSSTASPTTTPEPTTIAASDESLQDIDIEERDSIEDPSLKPRNAPPKKTVKIQRRPLTSLRDLDQNPEATNEEKKGQTSEGTSKEVDGKRQSKKFSASFKQNQLNEVLMKSQSQEEFDVGTDRTTVVDDLNAETAVAIAAHQLLTAPLPSVPDYDKKYVTKAYQAKEYPTTKQYHEEVTNTPLFSSSFSPTFEPSDFSTGLPRGSSSTSGASYLPTTGLPKTKSSTYSIGLSGNGYTVQQTYGPSTARHNPTDKYISLPIEEFGYSTDSYVGGLSQEPTYFTREYLLESPVTKTYDDEYQYLSPITTPTTTTTRKSLPKKTIYRKISTTIRPTLPPATPPKPRRTPLKPKIKPFEKVKKTEPARTYRPIENYDYYDDSDEKVAGKYEEGTKVIVHAKGTIECLDIGNFPHPTSCKKFISCARMESGGIIGWEYVCPRGLSFDPVGGICNWSAGLGCHEN